MACCCEPRLGPRQETEEEERDRARRIADLLVAAHASLQKERQMHYKNGREAKNGDKVVLIPSYGPPVAGILYDAQAGNDFCNGRIALTSPSDPCPNLKECLHADDVAAALAGEVPDTSKG